ncbi:MAG: BtpA/SgcQ family protein [Alicyclobacillus sp.]|nr:BtpA/SgcQ family protein [Alicyclobacillus sp.]
MSWLREVFGTDKPIIGMVHLPALPGSADYDEQAGMEWIFERTRADLHALQEGGIHAVMFCNENDRPYNLKADTAAVAAMAFVIGRLRSEIRVPFGVDVLWDPMSAVALAAGTGARFIREIFTGTYESDMGLWSPAIGEVARYRRLLGNRDTKLLFNIQAEFASPLGRRDVVAVAKSVVMSSKPDAVCVSGPMTGHSVPLETVEAVKRSVQEVPVFVNTGVNDQNVADVLRVADGVVIGTFLKRDGVTWNEVDPARVRRLLTAAQNA